MSMRRGGWLYNELIGIGPLPGRAEYRLDPSERSSMSTMRNFKVGIRLRYISVPTCLNVLTLAGQRLAKAHSGLHV
jgi:hypothetical protein